MHTKTSIFNLALGALLLSKRIEDADTDTNLEARVLRTHWDVALAGALEDMDLDSTRQLVTLELVANDPDDIWAFAYKYPTNCAFFRRIRSTVSKSAAVDDRRTHVPKGIGILGGQKVIFTDEVQAKADIIPFDLPLTVLGSSAGMAVAHRLAMLSAPLVTGKGSVELMERLEKRYIFHKTEAQESDSREAFMFSTPDVESEFVAERLS